LEGRRREQVHFHGMSWAHGGGGSCTPEQLIAWDINVATAKFSWQQIKMWNNFTDIGQLNLLQILSSRAANYTAYHQSCSMLSKHNWTDLGQTVVFILLLVCAHAPPMRSSIDYQPISLNLACGGADDSSEDFLVAQTHCRGFSMPSPVVVGTCQLPFSDSYIQGW
jgi:hypothetical protein